MSVHGLGGRFSEDARRALLAMPSVDSVRAGLVGEPPADAEGYEIAPGVRCQKWPSRYLTPDVARVASMFRLAEIGMPPRTDGTLHWPPPLIQAFVRMAAERKVPRE